LDSPGIGSKAARLACGAVAAAALLAPAPALAGSGGTGVPGETPTTSTAPTTPAPVPGAKARIVRGIAVPPASAPPAVQAVIAAANRISTRPYKWGGGHQAWASSGYDCSGAVSYALHGGGFLDTPMDSGDLRRWGTTGAGQWISVYTNPSHAYAVIAGLRWDTSGNAPGISGPRWHKNLRASASAGYTVRHADGY
jgi:cell wall-associated NlpC family hydrolase